MTGFGYSLISFVILISCTVVDCMRNEATASESVEIVYLDSLADLPDQFEIAKMPGTLQPNQDQNGQVKFDFLGFIDKLLKRQPDDPFTLDTQFHLFNGGQRRTVPFKLFKNCIRSKRSDDVCQKYPINLNEMLNIFDMRKRTLIIIGGFLSDAPAEWQLQIADKWLRLEDINVIIVSWNKGNKYMYTKAVANTKVVARQTTLLLYYLAKLHNLDPRDEEFSENIMIVGHSLGAHIAGFIGQDFGGKIGRITGLDPAGPGFTTSKESHRLDRNDAILVDVIHTNADFGFKFFLGLYTPMGHVDYYANDGKWQPNCEWKNFFECNHSAVINYYIAILDHELIIRDYFDRNLREKYRIIAYRAKSYNQFRSGQSMYINCPMMSNDSYDTFYQAGYVDFNHCTLPIDFIKKPREFREELQDKFYINFEADHVTTAKFWFFTSSKHPYVVDHNLIKLHYSIPSESTGFDKHAKSCSMNIEYTMLDGEKEQSKLPEFRPTTGLIDEYDEHPQTIVPFVVDNRLGRYMLIDIDSENFFIDEEEGPNQAELEKTIMKHVYKIFPAKIRIKTTKLADPEERSQPGVVGAMFGVLRKINSINGDERPKKGQFHKEGRNWKLARSGDRSRKNFDEILNRPNCPYLFKTVRVQPLRTTNRFFMAIYTTQLMDPENGLNPNIVVLKKGEDIPKIYITEDQDGLLEPNLHLTTIIIGQNHFGLHVRDGPADFKTPYMIYLDGPDSSPLDQLDIKAEFMNKKLGKNKDRLKQLEAHLEPTLAAPDDKTLHFDLEQNQYVTLRTDVQLIEDAINDAEPDDYYTSEEALARQAQFQDYKEKYLYDDQLD